MRQHDPSRRGGIDAQSTHATSMASCCAASQRRRKNPGDTTASLPDDILFDILSRLPVKSLCRCKAVSPRWRSLISHEDYSSKFPQTLPCLLCCNLENTDIGGRLKKVWHVRNVCEGPTPRRPLVYPSLSFLPSGYTILDCCNGMLLCGFSESNSPDVMRYLVCNPVEMTIIVLPDSGRGANRRVPILAFDPASYPEFHVLEFVMNVETNPYHDLNLDMEDVVGANIYSSVTGAWNYKQSGWPPEVSVDTFLSHAFFNGFLHFPFTDDPGILVVEVKGEKWCTIPCPYDAVYDGSEFVGIYKGHLCYISINFYQSAVLSYWILEDYTKCDWTLKHQVSTRLLCKKHDSFYFFRVIGILPDCNSILYPENKTLMAYDMDHEEAHAIQELDCQIPRCFLYVPFYTG